MGQELQVPDWAKNAKMSAAFAGLDPHADALTSGAGQPYGIIGYRGKVWSFRLNGESHNINRPDDGTPSSFIDVVLLGQGAERSKTYYQKKDKFDEGSHEKPLCASIDGVVPDDGVPQKQHDNCALCPRNRWLAGGGKECSDYKRLAVVIMEPHTKPIFGKGHMDPVFLRVPPDSLKNLKAMTDDMTKQNFHWSSYVTRITFDPDKPHPCMLFRPVQRLEDKEGEAVVELRKHPLVKRITWGDAGRMVGTSSPQTSAPPLAPAPVTLAVGAGGNGQGVVIENRADAGVAVEPQVPLGDDPPKMDNAPAVESTDDLDAMIAEMTKSHLGATAK
jgi:hypothetical protein